MRRECGACRKPIRWDESLSTAHLEGQGGEGYYQACPRCIAAASGEPVPAPRTYPPGQVPRHPLRDDLLPVCGLCREALFEGEEHSRFRITAEDTEGTGVEPGAYAACPRCLLRWRPVIHARLIREEVLSPTVPHFALKGNALL